MQATLETCHLVGQLQLSFGQAGEVGLPLPIEFREALGESSARDFRCVGVKFLLRLDKLAEAWPKLSEIMAGKSGTPEGRPEFGMLKPPADQAS